MEKLRLSINFTIFFMFLGVGLFEAIHLQNWLRVSFWIVLALIFLFSDGFQKRSKI